MSTNDLRGNRCKMLPTATFMFVLQKLFVFLFTFLLVKDMKVKNQKKEKNHTTEHWTRMKFTSSTGYKEQTGFNLNA